jgi:hypothetical protein
VVVLDRQFGEPRLRGHEPLGQRSRWSRARPQDQNPRFGSIMCLPEPFRTGCRTLSRLSCCWLHGPRQTTSEDTLNLLLVAGIFVPRATVQSPIVVVLGPLCPAYIRLECPLLDYFGLKIVLKYLSRRHQRKRIRAAILPIFWHFMGPGTSRNARRIDDSTISLFHPTFGAFALSFFGVTAKIPDRSFRAGMAVHNPVLSTRRGGCFKTRSSDKRTVPGSSRVP